MTYDLALYPASGPGLGHLMRCYALAEAAVEMGKKVAMCFDKPTDFGWPCAVTLDPGADSWIKSTHAIVDGVANRKNEAWYIIDDAKDATKWCHPRGPAPRGYIYPHFGATPIPGYPTLYGEQWMPLRKQFRSDATAHGSEVGVYHAPEGIESGARILTGDTAKALRECIRVVVPPSTIAYEAMALNVNVELHDGVEGYEHIADAMIRAGVAIRWRPDFNRLGRRIARPIDGLGAKRILEALL